MANYDQEKGIHYGVISVHDIYQAWFDSGTPNYGPAQCPKCGSEAKRAVEVPDFPVETAVPVYAQKSDFYCEKCEVGLDSDDVYPEYAESTYINDNEYAAESCLDSDVIVMRSPYYAFVRLCSPCVPNAGDLNSPDVHGHKTYCFGHDFFDNQRAPYKVYRVSDDTEVPSVMPDDAITTKTSQLALQYPDHEVLAVKVWMNGLFYGILRNDKREALFVCAKRDLSDGVVQHSELKNHDKKDITGFLGLLLQYRLFYEHPIIRKESEV